MQAIIFDFDDTLVHTYENGLDNLKEVSNQLGLSLPPKEHLLKHYGNGWKEFIESAFPGTDPDFFAKKYLSSPSFKTCPPVKGVHEILDILCKKYTLGIVTAGNKEVCMSSLIKAGIDIKKFSFILTQDEIKKPKKDPSYFDVVSMELAKIGISKREVLFVGDSTFDHEAAKNAGISFVGVLTGPCKKEDFLALGVKEQMIIPSVFELPYLIENTLFKKED